MQRKLNAQTFLRRKKSYAKISQSTVIISPTYSNSKVHLNKILHFPLQVCQYITQFSGSPQYQRLEMAQE